MCCGGDWQWLSMIRRWHMINCASISGDAWSCSIPTTAWLGNGTQSDSITRWMFSSASSDGTDLLQMLQSRKQWRANPGHYGWACWSRCWVKSCIKSQGDSWITRKCRDNIKSQIKLRIKSYIIGKSTIQSRGQIMRWWVYELPVDQKWWGL